MDHAQKKLLTSFDREVEIVYHGETYRVRDNGAVCRQRRPHRRQRWLDGLWTFGSANPTSGYMHHCHEVVHRIVATAFHGARPSDKHIVDHIDTNRRNNRPDNLRWVTRLENILNNPVSRRRIELAFGSIDAFFANPRSPLDPNAERTFDWMRPVSQSEAQHSRAKLERWAAAGKRPSGGRFSEWVYGATSAAEPDVDPAGDVQSLSPQAIQRKWRTPTSFPLCPAETTPTAIEDYVNRLVPGSAFSRNEYGESLVVSADVVGGDIFVVCALPKNTVKGWALSKVSIENDRFVHVSIGSFFTEEGAHNARCRLLGLPYESSIDDYC